MSRHSLFLKTLVLLLITSIFTAPSGTSSALSEALSPSSQVNAYTVVFDDDFEEGKTNWFQMEDGGLTAPGDPTVNQEMRGDIRMVTLEWNTAIAGKDPIRKYEIIRDGEKVGELPHQPQTGTAPFHFEDKPGNRSAHTYKLVSVDAGGIRAEGEELVASTV